jgi:hypothetical protein
LLHHFVEDGPGGFVHLVELVNAASTAIGQNQGTGLQDHLLGLGVTSDIGCQTDSRRTLTTGVDTTGGNLMHVTQKLGLGGRRVTAKQDVNITTVARVTTLLEGLVGTAEHLQQNTLLHIVRLVDTGGQGPRQQLVDVRTGSSAFNLLLFLGRDLAGLVGLGSLLGHLLLDGGHVNAHLLAVNLLHMQDIDVGLEESLLRALTSTDAHRVGTENTRHLDTVTSFADIDQFVVDTQRHRVRGLAIRDVVWGFL